MRFSYEAAFGKSYANGYERLLLDGMLGDATLFSHRDGVEALSFVTTSEADPLSFCLESSPSGKARTGAIGTILPLDTLTLDREKATGN